MRLLLPLALTLAATTVQAQQPAGQVLAKAIAKARQAKGLERLIASRSYRGTASGHKSLLTFSGTDGARGLTLRLECDVPFQPKLSFTIEHDFDERDRLERIAVRRGSFNALGVISGTDMTYTSHRLRSVKPEPRLHPWSPDTLPLSLSIFLAPGLMDYGLPRSFDSSLVDDDLFYLDPRAVRLVTTPIATTGESPTVRLELMGRIGRGSQHLLVGQSGSTKGIAIELGGGLRWFTGYRLAGPAEVKAFRAERTLLEAEGLAVDLLTSLRFAQSSYHHTHKSFAGSYDAIKGWDTLDQPRFAALTKSYVIRVHRSPKTPAKAWMAIASPRVFGKTGRFYYVTNQEGDVYRSRTPPRLDDGCAIPPKLERVR